MQRRRIVAGNWKMNKNFLEGLLLINGVVSDLEQYRGEVEVIFATPFIHLHTAVNMLKGHSRYRIAAQNCHFAERGAYTGEISVEMLVSVGAEYALVGHSERRQYFGETDEQLAQKAAAVLRGGLSPIFCCGEPLEVRQAGGHEAHVRAQLQAGIFGLSAEDFARTVIAYEPVWAIGTGQTATPEQAQAMHASIRGWISERYGTAIAQQTPILYGGSCNAANAASLFAMPDIDGALVGGASLQASDFVKIIKAGAESA